MASTPDNQGKKAPAKKAPGKAITKKAPGKATTKKAPAKATVTASAKTRGRPGRPAPSHEATAKRAYELYEAQGGGDHVALSLEPVRDVS